MKNRIIKFTVLVSVFTFILATTAFAALPNMYGKDYSKKKQGHICSMIAKGDKNYAETSITNTASGTRYYSVYVNRRHAGNNAVIESDCKEQLVKEDKSLKVSVTRYRSTKDREHYHKVMSWNCTMKPSGAGYTNFLDDTWSYTIKQTK